MRFVCLTCTEKHLEALLYGHLGADSGAGGCLHQSAYPPLDGLLEVWSLPYSLDSASPGVRLEPVAENGDSHGSEPSWTTLAAMQAADTWHGSFGQESDVYDTLVSCRALPQSVVFESINSGVRHFAVLDLGRTVELTDAVFYPCPQLSSLAIHVWAEGEDESACECLAVCTDISQHSLVLQDLLPPPSCRYIKVSFFFSPQLLLFD